MDRKWVRWYFLRDREKGTVIYNIVIETENDDNLDETFSCLDLRDLIQKEWARFRYKLNVTACKKMC